MPRRFQAFVEIRRDWRTPVVRLSGESLRDPNQSTAPPLIDYNYNHNESLARPSCLHYNLAQTLGLQYNEYVSLSVHP